MKIFGTIIQTFFMTALLAVVVLLMVPFLPYDIGLELRIVESGSMEPGIPTGSLVAIYPAKSYGLGDIVTFESTFADVPTTHRIVDSYQENGKTWFITKGDANEEADSAAVPLGSVIGQVRVSVPYIGFVLDFARQPLGFALLIVLPALAIIIGELEKIWKELRRRREPTQSDESEPMPRRFSPSFTTPVPDAPLAPAHDRPMMDIHTPVRYRMLPTLDLRGVTPRPVTAGPAIASKRNWFNLMSVVVAAVVLFSAGMIGTTMSYVMDGESTRDNSLAAALLDFSVIASGEAFDVRNGQLEGDGQDDGTVSFDVIEAVDSLPGRYSLSVDVTGGNTSLCDALNAEAAAPFSYDGSLTGLSATDVTFPAAWDLQLRLPNPGAFVNGDLCLVDLVFVAWFFDEEADQGYYDEERIPLTFTVVEEIIQLEQLLAPQSFSSVNTEDTEGETAKEEAATIEETALDTEDGLTQEEASKDDVAVEEETETIVEPESLKQVEEVTEAETNPTEEAEVSEETDATNEVESEI